MWSAVQKAMESNVLGITRSGTKSTSNDSGAAGAVGEASLLQLDPVAHKMSLVSNVQEQPSKKAKKKSTATAGGRVGRVLLCLQVFQSVQISIKVKGGDGTERRLVIALMHDGVELDGEVDGSQDVMEVES